MKKPNILILHTDQQRWDTIKANGNSVIKTPNLDRLATSGTNFSSCYSQNPVCMPSRISFMTGQYCSALKITQMAVTVPQETETIQKILGRNGYYNGLIGKLHYLAHSNRDHRELHPSYDFHHLELSDEPGCYEDAYRAWVRRKAPEELDNISLGLPPVFANWAETVGYNDRVNHRSRWENGKLIKGASAFPGRDDVTQAAFVGEQTMEFLEAHRDQAFFCFSGFYSPHSPWVVPQKYLDLYDPKTIPIAQYPREWLEKQSEPDFSEEELRSITCGYYAMISEVDHWVGQILDKLDELDLTDNTIIVFTSDHGEWLGEHHRFGKGHWAPDCISRVPMIVKVPEALGGAKGRQVEDHIECVDVVPTLLEQAGIQITPEIQGHVLPVMKKSNKISGDGMGLTEHKDWRSLRFEHFRYVAEADGREKLFDLNADPMEYKDVADEPGYTETLNRARKLLIGRMLRIEQPYRKDWAY
jgi:arylsulfatase A-like enzyme